MKCQELMVGDFCRSGHGLTMQITNVGDDYAYATFEGNEGDPWEFNDKDDQPQPIEITKELLKANGWGVCSYNFLSNLIRYYCVKDEGENHLIWERGILTIWSDCKKYNDGVVADIVITCKYIHQIQQLLRITGMTELANNFKI